MKRVASASCKRHRYTYMKKQNIKGSVHLIFNLDPEAEALHFQRRQLRDGDGVKETQWLSFVSEKRGHQLAGLQERLL